MYKTKEQPELVMQINQAIKYTVTISLCLSFLINSLMVGWRETRRTAENKALIINAKTTTEDTTEKEQKCIEGGGMPDYNNHSKFIGCKTNNLIK